MNERNSDQRDFWTDQVGQIWVDQSAPMDALLAPVLEGVLSRAQLGQGDSVLDIGCGAGTSTMEVAALIGDTGHVTGIDISRTLLGAAQERAMGYDNIGFLDADAQSYPFVAQSADVILSRFGVMFFEDTEAAFRNIAKALRADGRISFATWGAIRENPFFTLPAAVARAYFGPSPKSDPDAPGPFALRDPSQLTLLLQSAGLVAQVETVEVPLVFKDSKDALAECMCYIGPAHSAFRHFKASKSQREALKDALCTALAPYQSPDGITIPAQINFATARKAT